MRLFPFYLPSWYRRKRWLTNVRTKKNRAHSVTKCAPAFSILRWYLSTGGIYTARETVLNRKFFSAFGQWLETGALAFDTMPEICLFFIESKNAAAYQNAGGFCRSVINTGKNKYAHRYPQCIVRRLAGRSKRWCWAAQ